ncbi:sulfatase-modifying factor 1-like [Copidosoma floridanum]|uniref:sulfatase-modifying factor 1-like n=1 Tax=Copidosoma floridanum TaxID=29053 RepID=UPI0006C987A8|nr:sulfatase-modifying factor 1-like [Copidosoma floridanum]
MAVYYMGLKMTAVCLIAFLVRCLLSLPTEEWSSFKDSRTVSTVMANWHYIGTDDLNHQFNGEGPRRLTKLKTFYIDKYLVSNVDFEMFVKETGYMTEAEKNGSSHVFDEFLSPRVKRNIRQAVLTTSGALFAKNADWRRPEGINSNLLDRMDLAVVHVSWKDAAEYCKWVNGRLPTEAEWEATCRSGPDDKRHTWGNNMLMPNGQSKKNTEYETVLTDDLNNIDYILSSNRNNRNPIVNIWEWTSDWWTVKHSAERQIDPTGPPSGSDKVTKGGSSYMCLEGYCSRNNCAARRQHAPDFSANNIGFRCASTHDYY